MEDTRQESGENVPASVFVAIYDDHNGDRIEAIFSDLQEAVQFCEAGGLRESEYDDSGHRVEEWTVL